MILERDDFGQVHGIFPGVEFFHGKIDKLYKDCTNSESLTEFTVSMDGKPCGCCQSFITFEKNHGLFFYEAAAGDWCLSMLKPDKYPKAIRENALKLFSDYIVKIWKRTNNK